MSSSNDKTGDAPVYQEQTPVRHHVRDHPDQKLSIGRYLATRIPTLKPPMDKLENPFTLLAMLSFKQWMFFLVAFFGWTWDVRCSRCVFNTSMGETHDCASVHELTQIVVDLGFRLLHGFFDRPRPGGNV